MRWEEVRLGDARTGLRVSHDFLKFVPVRTEESRRSESARQGSTQLHKLRDMLDTTKHRVSSAYRSWSSFVVGPKLMA